MEGGGLQHWVSVYTQLCEPPQCSMMLALGFPGLKSE